MTILLWLPDQKSYLLLTYQPVVTRHEPQFIKPQWIYYDIVLCLFYFIQ